MGAGAELDNNVWDDATDWCKWLEWWGIMRIDIILQMRVTYLLTDKRESWDAITSNCLFQIFWCILKLILFDDDNNDR